MSQWVTQREAAEVLGVHVSLIPKMLRRGDLTSRQRRPSLLLADVEALRRHRAEPKPPKRRPRKPEPQPPDTDHEWLDSGEAALVMGIGRTAVVARGRRGRLPSQVHDGRRWFRRDHLDLVRRADDIKRGRAALDDRTAG